MKKNMKIILFAEIIVEVISKKTDNFSKIRE